MRKMSKRAEAIKSQNIPLEAPKAVETALATLEEALGGREAITTSLSLASLSEEETTVLYLLCDPANAGKSLAWVVGSAGITIGKLLELFSKGEFADSYVKAIRKVYKAIPDVAEDVMKGAVTRFKTCSVCEGVGKVTIRREVFEADGAQKKPREFEDVVKRCLNCEGSGKVEIEADLERQKVALQMGGLLKQPGGVVVNNTQQTTNNSANVTIRSSADFRTATDRLLYPGRQKSLPEATAPDNFIADAEILPEKVDVPSGSN